MERRLTSFMHARGAALSFMAAAVAVAVVARYIGLTLPIVPDLGLGIPVPGLWIPSPGLSLLAAVAVNLAVGVLVIWINRAFNTLRSLTELGATFFFVMQCATPPLLAQFYGGLLLVLTILLCVVLLFSVYADRAGAQQRVYLAFFLVTAGGFSQASFLLYLPVLLIGCLQMRVFNLRTLLAAVFGVITPPWILFGFGIVDPRAISWPSFVQLWQMLGTAEMVKAMAITAFTLILGFSFMAMNLLKILSYNSRTRAFNGFINILWIATAIFTIINFNDFSFYFPLLNALSAYQAAHFFTYRRNRRSYLPILLIIIIYAFFSVWAFI